MSNDYQLVYILDNKKIERYLKELKAPFSYNLNIKNYIFHYYKSFSIKDFSFFILKNDNPLAFVPIHVSKNNNNIFSISIADTPVLSPIFSQNILRENYKIILDIIFQEIFQIVKSNNISYSIFEVSPFIYLNCDLSKKDFYKEYGYVENYYFNNWYIYACDSAQLIDLSLPLQEILRDFNYNRRNDILMNKNKILILNSKNILAYEDIFNKFCTFKCNQKKINVEILNEEKSLIINNNQILGVEINQNEIVSYVGIFLDNFYSYKNSVSGHATAVLFESIKYLKDNGIKYLWNSHRLKKSLDKSKINIKFAGLNQFSESFGKNNFYPWKKFFKC